MTSLVRTGHTPRFRNSGPGTRLPNFAQGRHEGDCAPHVYSIVEAIVVVYIKFGINCLSEIVIRNPELQRFASTA